MPAETPNARPEISEKFKLSLSKPWLVLDGFDAEQVEVLLNTRIRFGFFRVFLNYPTLILPGSSEELLVGRRRHAVRSGVNKAKINGYTARRVNRPEAEDLYLEVHRKRGEHSGLRPLPQFEKLGEAFTPLIVAVENQEGGIAGFAYGLGRLPVLRLHVSVTTTRNDGARFLLTYESLREAQRLGFKVVLPDPPVHTSEADSYYQSLWGFRRTNLLAVKLKLMGRRRYKAWMK